MQGRGEALVRNPCHKYFTLVVLYVGNRIHLLRVELQPGLGIGFAWDCNLRVGYAVQFQNLQLPVIHLHDRWDGICSSAALNRKEDLLCGLMNRHVINNDLVGGCTEERGQFLIQTNHVVPAFEVVKVAGYEIRL
jgi:hypothetical protein